MHVDFYVGVYVVCVRVGACTCACWWHVFFWRACVRSCVCACVCMRETTATEAVVLAIHRLHVRQWPTHSHGYTSSSWYSADSVGAKKSPCLTNPLPAKNAVIASLTASVLVVINLHPVV